MIENYPCPVCQSTQWQPIQQFHYDANDHTETAPIPKYLNYWYRLRRYVDLLWHNAPKPRNITVKHLTAQEKLRRQVLFECWFPSETKVTLTSLLCRNCGLMTYTPRPTESDLQKKYGFLTTIPDHKPEKRSKNANLENRRAKRIYQTIFPEGNITPLRILDYGGGNGQMLTPFLEQNHQCFLIDYEPHTLPGITKLGDTIEAVSPDKSFDVILCSHVLEHLTNPREILEQLRQFLTDDGIIYAEVPSEIWGGIRIEYDPVTHINYFTEENFKLLFNQTEHTVTKSRTQLGSYGKYHKEIIWLTAKKTHNQSEPPSPITINTKKLLNPGRIYTLKKFIRLFIQPRLKNY